MPLGELPAERGQPEQRPHDPEADDKKRGDENGYVEQRQAGHASRGFILDCGDL